MNRDTRVLLYSRMKEEQGFTLKKDELDLIESVYQKEKRFAIFTVGMYRFINLVFAALFLLVLYLVLKTKIGPEFFLFSVIIFMFYNGIHLAYNIIQYYKIKKKTNAGK